MILPFRCRFVASATTTNKKIISFFLFNPGSMTLYSPLRHYRRYPRRSRTPRALRWFAAVVLLLLSLLPLFAGCASQSAETERGTAHSEAAFTLPDIPPCSSPPRRALPTWRHTTGRASTSAILRSFPVRKSPNRRWPIFWISSRVFRWQKRRAALRQ